MTGFEIAYRCAAPFVSPLQSQVRRAIRRELRAMRRARPDLRPEIVDVGGRKSHYTIGLPARVTVTELPRVSGVQVALNLGLTDELAARTRARRSNLHAIVFDDMTVTRLPAHAYDVAVAVEVLEHVDDDAAFVRNVARVLRPGGVFIMTTPNGNAIPVPHNPDHRRHYPRTALDALLREAFAEVTVQYAIAAGRARTLGLSSWSARRPLQTLTAMAANVVNAAQSAAPGIRSDALHTRHLIAVARTEG